jgi:alkylation response protein AidB-like acyl-CoA dehydrogenase
VSDLSTYREELRAWLRAHAPAPSPTVDLAAAQRFQAALFDAGYAGITWPKDVGGQGLGPEYQQVFSDEAAEYELPVTPFTIGLGMCGPTVNDLGTAEQRTRYLPKLLRGEEVWCQLFSEPGAGSDVASLQTRAVRDDADGTWVVDGQKVWTTGAQFSDYGALLARTDPDRPKHSGLTMFVIDMHAPGVTVRPLKDMSGRAPFNEIMFDGVRLPADAVIGEVNAGWSAAVTMLGHERVTIGSRRTAKTNPLDFEAVHALARDLGVDGEHRALLAELYARERVLELFNVRVRQETAAGNPPGARGSVGKLAGAMLSRFAVEVVGEVAGPAAAGWEDERGDAIALGITASPSSGIAGGTNEIQRGIIGDRILSLPKEPSVDRGVPFRELKVGTQR